MISLRWQILAALVGPALLVVASVAWLAEDAASRALEATLAERLTTVAQAAVLTAGPRIIILAEGDDDSRLAKGTRQKLEQLQGATGVARILLVRSDARVWVDSNNTLKIGQEYHRARFDQPELEKVAGGATAASVLFAGAGDQPFKTGYAPLLDEDQKVVGFAAVDAPANYTQAIGALRSRVLAAAAFGLGLLVMTASVLARRVSVPLSRLSEVAQKIGEGALDTPVPAEGPKEAVVLGETMRRMTASLQAREEEMQLMLAGIAHEVRNPLGGIELFGGILREDLEGDPRQKHVDKILRELGTLGRVVSDFLDYARRRPPDLRAVAVGELLQEVVALAEKEASEKEIKIELVMAQDWVVTLDPEAVKRALLNLLRNAIQATEKGKGRISLEAQAGDDMCLSVEDNGPGIPPDKQDEVFRPFFTTKQKGTGLGLALVKKTVEAHGGKIKLGQGALGGARFELHLPQKKQ